MLAASLATDAPQPALRRTSSPELGPLEGTLTLWLAGVRLSPLCWSPHTSGLGRR